MSTSRRNRDVSTLFTAVPRKQLMSDMEYQITGRQISSLSLQLFRGRSSGIRRPKSRRGSAGFGGWIKRLPVYTRGRHPESRSPPGSPDSSEIQARNASGESFTSKVNSGGFLVSFVFGCGGKKSATSLVTFCCCTSALGTGSARGNRLSRHLHSNSHTINT